MTNSLKKGHRFERKVAKWLSSITGAKFYRTPNSGATATSFAINSFAGDVLTEEQAYSGLVIECKHHSEPTTINDLFNKKSKFWRWVFHAQRESGGRAWVLFFKSDRGKTFACFEEKNKDTFSFLEARMQEKLFLSGLIVGIVF